MSGNTDGVVEKLQSRLDKLLLRRNNDGLGLHSNVRAQGVISSNVGS